MKIVQAQDIKSYFNIAIIINRDETGDYCDNFAHALVARLKELEFSEDKIILVNASSFLDIPLFAKTMAETNEYAAILSGGFYQADERDEYLSIVNACTSLSVNVKTPILLKGFNCHELTIDHINHDARDLAERAYSAVSIMRQLS